MGLNLIYRFDSLVVRKLKIIFTIIIIFLVVLWFGGNLGLYLYLKYKIITPERVEVFNQVPKRLILKESNLDSNSICFSNLKFKFPFYKDDISLIKHLIFVNPTYNYQSIWIGTSLRKDGESKYISLNCSNIPKVDWIEQDRSLTEWFWSLLPGDYKEKSLTEVYRIALYTTINDYSLWNLNNNLKMVIPFALKSMKYFNDDLTYYDTSTSNIDGLLLEIKQTVNGRERSYYNFEISENENNYSIFYSTSDEEDEDAIEFIKNIIATIEFIDKEECYKKMEAEYKDKENSNYPEELLLLSLISIKGPTVENLTELKKLMEEKNYSKDDIDRLDEQIKILKEIGSNTDK
ncbi:hypothetical protein MYX76_15025 [Desulfobacterota bacterium AH_259_B03_O07]|nr:hypothetical protein [Desulfobacterota bacterium AH_259_B03_O07]